MHTYQKTKNTTLRPDTMSSPTFVHSGTEAVLGVYSPGAAFSCVRGICEV